MSSCLPLNSTNSFLSAMLTDFYEITIARSYFNEGRQDEPASFDLFYREQPFDGSFAIFAGLSEVIRFLSEYHFTEEQLLYIKSNLTGNSDAFIDYLRHIDTKKLRIYAPPEGSVVFPKSPLLRIEGPLALCQLIETPLLNSINFPTLMATNALRFRIHVGARKLMEFGLRRAQGSDGGMAASKYSYMGLFDSTSNVLAGHLYNIPISGTVAHSFITSFYDASQLKTTCIKHAQTDEMIDLLKYANQVFEEMHFKPNPSETIAFVAQALSYPDNFLALADTYDSIKSGVPNFLGVSYGLEKAGYRGRGIRLDSGDLAELSKKVRNMYREFGKHFNLPYAEHFIVSASNNINEKKLFELEENKHEIDMFGIGTHLVTCEKQPALGGVYKLVEVNGVARVKLSDNIEKSTIPCRKMLFRCYDESGKAIADIMTMLNEKPVAGRIEAYQVFPNAAKVVILCEDIKPLYNIVWGEGAVPVENLHTARERVLDEYKKWNKEVLAVRNEKQYCVALSQNLHAETARLIQANQVL